MKNFLFFKKSCIKKMANGNIVNWTIFCETEGKNVIATQRAKPTICPNNAAHTINTSTMTYEINTGIPVLTDVTKNQGFYSTYGIFFPCPASVVTTYNISFPYDIIVLGGTLHIEDFNQGDNLNIVMTPELLVGALTAAVNTGDTVINVSSTVINYIVKACFIKLGSDEYIVKSVNLMNSTLTLTTAVINGYSAGTLVYRNLYIIENFTLPSKKSYHVGVLNQNKTFVPAGYIFRFNYTNNTNVDKSLNFFVEHI